MKKLYIFILFISILNTHNCIFAQQHTKVMYNYKGNGGDTRINFWYDIVLTFDIPITGQLTMEIVPGANKGVFCPNIKSDAIINNTLSNVNRTVNPSDPKISITANETLIGDYYQNNIFFNIAPGYNKNTVSLPIKYDNMSALVNFANAVIGSDGSFPVNQSSLPSSVLKYLAATDYVESTNTKIISQAQSITSGCTDYRDAVLKLCKWIEANIKMQDNAPETKSSQVLANGYAKCDGAAHLLAAFCRSLNIPTRIINGNIILHGVSFPKNKDGGTFTHGSGNGTTLAGHAACEVYVPNENAWVR
jgi:hypothetical protein